jgi:hypothetical protein
VTQRRNRHVLSHVSFREDAVQGSERALRVYIDSQHAVTAEAETLS